MKPNRIRVFRAGAGTVVVWEKVSRGDPIGKIESTGTGTFVSQAFDSLREAREFCEAEVERMPSDSLYLMIGEDILQEIASHQKFQAKLRKSDMVYEVASTAVIGVVAAIGFLVTSPFQSVFANLGLAVIAIALYLLFSWGMGGNIETAVALIIILSCAFLVISAVKKSRVRKEKQNQPSALLVTPQTASTSTHYG